MRHVRKEDEGELARLRSAWCEGVTFDEMQKRFKRTRRWIVERCSDLERPTVAKGKRTAPSLGRVMP